MKISSSAMSYRQEKVCKIITKGNISILDKAITTQDCLNINNRIQSLIQENMQKRIADKNINHYQKLKQKTSELINS